MAYALSNTTTTAAFDIVGKLNEIAAAWKLSRTRRAVYNRTYNELNTLSDRDLADIGVARSQIAGIARIKAAKAL